jgi:hypothetical protein
MIGLVDGVDDADVTAFLAERIEDSFKIASSRVQERF